MASRRAALVFPPLTDPRSPHLAVPSLAASLRGDGVDVTVRDLDVEGLWALLERDRLAVAAEVIAKRDGPSAPALTCSRYVVDHAPDAPRSLTDPSTFYDPHRFHRARESIEAALAMLSAARGTVDAGIGPIRYRVDGCDPGRIGDLDVATRDSRHDLYEDVWPDLPSELASADLVGVSILNHQQVIPGLRIARRCKEAGHRVVIGGTLFAKFREQLLARPRFFDLFCDALVAYEGETALRAMLSGDPTPPNTLWVERGRVVEGPVHVEDVTALPTPDFDDLPLDRYLAPEPVLPLLTGKGCYFNKCRFCDIPYINRVSPRPYRRRSADQLADDIATLADRHGARVFELTDEALAPRFLTAIGTSLRERHPHVDPRFVGYARFEPGYTREVFDELHASGVRKLFFGLESGSQRMLDHMDKGVQLETARRVLRDCSTAGIAAHLFSIIGFPEETEDDARATLQFFLDERDVLEAPQHSFDVHAFSLDLRTDYFDRADDLGVGFDRIELSSIDFPLSVPSFVNSRGLDEADVERLLGEFHAELRSAFPVHRRFPAHLWPSFEEYAVLYATHFEDRRFRDRLTVPDAGAGSYRLVWADDVDVDVRDDQLVAVSLAGAAAITPAVVRAFGEPRGPATGPALMDALARDVGASVDAVRTVTDELLAAGIVVLEPA